jgi:hypothetical protein
VVVASSIIARWSIQRTVNLELCHFVVAERGTKGIFGLILVVVCCLLLQFVRFSNNSKNQLLNEGGRLGMCEEIITPAMELVIIYEIFIFILESELLSCFSTRMYLL